MRFLPSFFSSAKTAPVRVRQEPVLEKAAAAQLTLIQPPKVSRKPVARPSYSQKSKTSNSDQRLTEVDRRTANTNLLDFRDETNTKKTIRTLAKVSPDLSASVFSYIRMVVTRNFSVIAYNQDGTTNPEATTLAQQVMNRFNVLQDYTDGFAGVQNIHSVAESLAKELRINGSCALELVLDKTSLPNRLQPISTAPEQLEFWEDNKNYVYPVQKSTAGDINLDIAAFFYETMDQDLLTAYSESPMEASLQAVLADTEFQNDVRRVIKRALHPRLDVEVMYEKLMEAVPQDIANDPDEILGWIEGYLNDITETINGLEPDDALIHFDAVKTSYLNNGNVTLATEYEVMQSINNAKMATGAKAPPAVLGHGSGSQNVASTETALFTRYCEGVQNHINSILSRAMTLAVRLMGADVYVRFEFDRVDLRPDSELEAFRSMKQSRVLMLLSIGYYTDEQACILLTGNLPPPGAPKLSGTFFYAGASSPDMVAAQEQAAAQNASGAQGQSLTPDTPTKPKGKTADPKLERVK